MNITIFTPTYNRGYVIPRLYYSLQEQTYKSFEWIIIDDGSTDNTSQIVEEWLKNKNDFDIRYYKVPNGGKQRAINKAVQLARYEYFFIVDSDDYLLPNCIALLIQWCSSIQGIPCMVGVAGIRCTSSMQYINGMPQNFQNKRYIDATNLERKNYNLTADMAEVYKVSILKKYPFPVWKDETFTPECVVWDAMALDGYKIRWYNKMIYVCEYLEDGLTKSGYKLYMRNLMGCAMANNIKLKSSKNLKEKYFYLST